MWVDGRGVVQVWGFGFGVWGRCHVLWVLTIRILFFGFMFLRDPLR